MWGNAYETHDNILHIFIAAAHQTRFTIRAAFLQSDVTSLPSAQQSPMFYVLIFAAISMGSSIIAGLNTAVGYVGSLRASQ